MLIGSRVRALDAVEFVPTLLSIQLLIPNFAPSDDLRGSHVFEIGLDLRLKHLDYVVVVSYHVDATKKFMQGDRSLTVAIRS